MPLPPFPTTMDVHTGPFGVVGALRFTADCNLKPTVYVGSPSGADYQDHQRWVYIAAGTDIRGPRSSSGQQDTVVIPSGSNNTFLVWDVWDVNKGQADEYRVAVLQVLSQATPMP